jgi:hypothetical protein
LAAGYQKVVVCSKGQPFEIGVSIVHQQFFKVVLEPASRWLLAHLMELHARHLELVQQVFIQ